MNLTRRLFLKLTSLLLWRISSSPVVGAEPDVALPFGKDFPKLDSLATGEWWKKGGLAASQTENKNAKGKGKGGQPAPPSMDVPRDEVVCYAYYTQQDGVLKMSAQLFPLKPGEERLARLEERALSSTSRREGDV